METFENQSNENSIPIRFHFYSLKFTPYKDSGQYNHNKILVDVITYLTKELQNGQGHLIDRHLDRDSDGPRELFMSSAVFMHKERRIRCSLALLRAGRQPMLKPADKFILIPLDKSQASIAEQTHFYIDFSKDFSVICVEFNHHGPRISDIEYYLRNVAREKLKLSKATEISLFMDTSIDKTLKDLKNVLNIDIKIQPRKLAQLDTELVGQYFTAITNLGSKIKPRFIKLEAMYQTQGRGVESSQINKEANTMFMHLLKRFRANPMNIDCFENFVVKYEDVDGKEEVFNLLKGKKEIVKNIDLSKKITAREWYEMIEPEFDEFMESLK